jgi:hypothetical protein
MATGDRSKRLKTNVQRVLGDLGEFKEEALPKSVYDALNRVQRRICEDASCLESKAELNLYQGEEFYDFPTDMIHERMLIPSGSLQLKHIGFEEVDRIKRSAQSTDILSTTSGDVTFYYKWGSQFGFLLGSGSVPGSDSTVTVYYWRMPSSSEEMSDSKDPLIESKWDSALFYGAVAELTGENAWYIRYENEMERRVGKERTTRSDPSFIAYNGSYD